MDKNLIRYVRLRITLKALTKVALTHYAGSTLRGLLKTSLRRLCCFNPLGVRCRDCEFAFHCPYAIVTENRTESGEDTILPYVLSCLSLSRRIYSEGEHLVFDLTVFGKAIQYIPHILMSLTRCPVYRDDPALCTGGLHEL